MSVLVAAVEAGSLSAAARRIGTPLATVSRKVSELEAHLKTCPPCRAYLATYRKTKELAAKVNRVDMPEDLKARLRALLIDQIRARPAGG